QVTKEAEIIAPEEITKIHRQVQFLAHRCDGAVELDGIGFNKIDARIGHEFAERATLTPRQAVLARRILKKYHRQLRVMEEFGI
ncbi:MAG: hypothetical protein KGL39_54220, partial [Patescibacteria group bacterium]|nr:hypothetical protein [Patescibacteria group bacterium]